MKQVSHHWTEGLQNADAMALIDDLALRLARRVVVSEGRALESLIGSRDYLGLLNFELNQDSVGWHENVTDLILCRQVLGFYSKNPLLPILNKDPEGAAWAKFTQAEGKCRESNELFRMICRGFAEMANPRHQHALLRARRFVANVLGPVPPWDRLGFRFGPGATSTIKKKNAVPMSKLAEPPSCSRELLASGYLPSLLREMPGYTSCHATQVGHALKAMQQRLRDALPCMETTSGRLESRLGDMVYAKENLADYVEGGLDCKARSITSRAFATADGVIVPILLDNARLQFVPKKALIDRTMITQPTLNTMWQAAFGDYMFRRLKTFGLDLRDQSENQALAWYGSLGGQTATLDLVSASDMMCKWLVRALLPPEWFALLSAGRCGAVEYKKKVYILEQFSAMGNGFTFPLMTLILWALVRAVMPPAKEVYDLTRVYGDDIICPSEFAGDVVSLLSACGFEVNTDKSYFSPGSPFRESCGADYYRGINVRPYYFDSKQVDGRALFTMHNYFFRQSGGDELCARIIRYIPTALRLYGPDGYGDGHLVSTSWQPTVKREHVNRGFGGVSFSTYRLSGRFVRSTYPGDYVSPLYSVYTGEVEPLIDDPKIDHKMHNVAERKRMVQEWAERSDGRSPTNVSPDGRPEWPARVDDAPELESCVPYEKVACYTFKRY